MVPRSRRPPAHCGRVLIIRVERLPSSSPLRAVQTNGWGHLGGPEFVVQGLVNVWTVLDPYFRAGSLLGLTSDPEIKD